MTDKKERKPQIVVEGVGEPKVIQRNDPVNHPAHYKAGGAECIDVIDALGLNYHEGNAMKYLWRCRQKNNHIEDLKKARWYLDRAIEAGEK